MSSDKNLEAVKKWKEDFYDLRKTRTNRQHNAEEKTKHIEMLESVITADDSHQWLRQCWTTLIDLNDGPHEELHKPELRGAVLEILLKFYQTELLYDIILSHNDNEEHYLLSSKLHEEPASLKHILIKIQDPNLRFEVLNLRNKDEQTPLHNEKWNGYDSQFLDAVLGSLNSKELCYYLLATQDNLGKTPLFFYNLNTSLAVLGTVEHQYAVKLVEKQDNYGRTILHSEWTPECVAKLLDYFHSVETRFRLLSIQDNNGNTPLFYLPPKSVINALHKVDGKQAFELVVKQDEQGNTLLHMCDLSEKKLEFERIFSSGYKWNSQDINQLLTLLQSAKKCLRLLRKQNNEGKTPLFYLSSDSVSTALSKVDKEWVFSLVMKQDREGQTMLHDHLKSDTFGIGSTVKLFNILDSDDQWFEFISVADKRGITALAYASCQHLSEVLELVKNPCQRVKISVVLIQNIRQIDAINLDSLSFTQIFTRIASAALFGSNAEKKTRFLEEYKKKAKSKIAKEYTGDEEGGSYQ